jgi:hypothetical protein
MTAKCEIDGCVDDAQSKLTTSGYELCSSHYEQWSTKNMFVLEQDGKVLLANATTGPGARRPPRPGERGRA